MLHTIRNEHLTLTVDDLGAQMMALTGAGGTEYLWSGDAAFWRNRAPNLFPYVGRSTEDSCTVRGVRYPMTRHGFANRSTFAVGSHGAHRIVFTLTDSPATRENYPWAFAFSVAYALEGSTVEITYEVINRDRETIYFGLGGHPGFRVPLEPGLAFTDYALTFGSPCAPDRVELSENYMVSGREARFPLEGGRHPAPAPRPLRPRRGDPAAHGQNDHIVRQQRTTWGHPEDPPDELPGDLAHPGEGGALCVPGALGEPARPAGRGGGADPAGGPGGPGARGAVCESLEDHGVLRHGGV